MTPQEYCEAKARQSGSSFYYSFFALPAQKRNAIVALYVFCREVDDIVDAESDVSIRQIKLQWWRDEIARLFAGNPQHPISRALAPVIQHYHLAHEYFLEILDGMQMDLDNQRYTDLSELNLYCYRVAGVVGLLSAEIFGYQNRDTLKYARELGLAFQLTNIIRDVHEDARKGRLYLPLDLLSNHHIAERDIQHGTAHTAIIPLVQQLADQARQHYRKAYQYLPAQDRYAQRSGLIMAAVYETLLAEISKDGYRVLEHRIELPPLRKAWIAMRTWCAEWLRHVFRLNRKAAA